MATVQPWPSITREDTLHLVTSQTSGKHMYVLNMALMCHLHEIHDLNLYNINISYSGALEWEEGYV